MYGVNGTQLRIPEEFYKIAFQENTIPSFILQKADTFHLAAFNSAADKFIPENLKDHTGKPIADLQIFNNLPDIQNDLNRCYEEKTYIYREEYVAFGTMNEGRVLKIHSCYLQQNFVLLILEEITKLKILERGVKEAHWFSDTLFENTGTPIVIVDEDTTILRINQQFTHLCGYSKEEVEGKKSWIEFVHPEDVIIMTQYHKARRKAPASAPHRYEFRFIDRYGRIHDILVIVTMIPASTKSIASLIDITDLKETQRNLSEALVRTDFYKDLLTHDIGNIFQSILLSVDLLQNLIATQPETEENITIIKEMVERGSNLLSNVRKLSTLEKSIPYIERVDAYPLLVDAIQFVKRKYRDRTIHISFTSPFKEIFVQANVLLRDVFENLLINAVKHNSNHTAEITIKVSKIVFKTIPYFQFEFIDNGPGIKDHNKTQIFQRIQGDRSSSSCGGIGLSLVNKIISLYQGRIWVEDRVPGDHNQGSKFILQIPLSL